MISTDFAPYEKNLKIGLSSARSWFILSVVVAVAVSSADFATSLPILLKLLPAALTLCCALPQTVVSFILLLLFLLPVSSWLPAFALCTFESPFGCQKR